MKIKKKNKNKKVKLALVEVPKPSEVKTLKIDLGCGKNKQKDYIGVDRIQFEGVDVVLDIGKEKWPWEDNSVDHVYCSHFVEHLDADERVHFVNELYRVLKVGSAATIIVPSWTSGRAYGDLTHKWPPICDFWFFYLSKDWRKVNAPHNDYNMYTCDFEVTWGFNLHPEILSRNEEYKAYALKFYKEAAQDIFANFLKK
jgi:hypothetical protein